MKRTHTINITSATGQPDFRKTGCEALDVMESLAVHLARCRTGKQVFSTKLEDGAEDFEANVRSQVTADVITINNTLALLPDRWEVRTPALLVVMENLARNVVDSVVDIRTNHSAKMRQSLIGLQACREIMDEMSIRYHPTK